ncbi:MAG: ferritin-like domain-containing protein [Sumerlaeia bacterium]
MATKKKTDTKSAAAPTKPRRAQTDMEENPIGLPQDYCEDMVPELDKLLSTEYTLLHQYHKHHWLVNGPQFRDLHLFYQEAYEALFAKVDDIAERVTHLGGFPTCEPANMQKKSIIDHEPEGLFSVRDMLARDKAAEITVAQNLRKMIAFARDHQDFGTVRLLEKVLLGGEDRAHHIDHFLEEDSLEEGRED